MDIHHAVRDDYEAKIVGLKPYEAINPNLKIAPEEYVQWKNPFMFHHSIVILHERKFLLLFWLLNTVFFQRIRLIYVHHNELYGHRWATMMPRTVVAISENGMRNLMEYFKVPRNRISKIHNCVEDRKPERASCPSHHQLLKILYPARINDVKRQLEIVGQLKGKLKKNVQILFAGVGPRFEEFQQTVNGDGQFVCLGFVADVPQLMRDCDYVMLFSTHEGLPITLIEAAMTGTPIICNDVGGNTEICHDGENGFVVNDWNGLILTLNSLGGVSDEEWEAMCRKSRAIYEKEYTFERFREQYLALLAKIGR